MPKFHGDDPGYFPKYDDAAAFEAKREAYAEAIDYSRAHPICPQQFDTPETYEHQLIGSLARACNIGRDMTVSQISSVVAKDKEFADKIVRLANSAPYRAGELRERKFSKGAFEVSEFRGPKAAWMSRFQPVGTLVMLDAPNGRPISIKTL